MDTHADSDKSVSLAGSKKKPSERALLIKLKNLDNGSGLFEEALKGLVFRHRTAVQLFMEGHPSKFIAGVIRVAPYVAKTILRVGLRTVLTSIKQAQENQASLWPPKTEDMPDKTWTPPGFNGLDAWRLGKENFYAHMLLARKKYGITAQHQKQTEGTDMLATSWIPPAPRDLDASGKHILNFYDELPLFKKYWFKIYQQSRLS